MEDQPSLRELAALDAVGLHARPTSWLTGRWIRPLERKAEPRAVACKRVIVHDHTDACPLRTSCGNLRCVGFSCYGRVTLFVVPDVLLPNATRDEYVLAFMPNPLPSIE